MRDAPPQKYTACGPERSAARMFVRNQYTKTARLTQKKKIIIIIQFKHNEKPHVRFIVL
jgi:hypothetical protein